MLQIFSWVCGQNAGHTWSPGGELLPMCQRCTGLYVGAALALVLLLVFRPRLNGRYRWIHVALVLGMIPFGFHLVPQGPVLRTVSGHYFSFGVIGLLWLLPGLKYSAPAGPAAGRGRLHVLLGVASVVLLPAIACWGGTPTALLLPWIGLTGLVAFAGLLLANIAIFCSWLLSRLHARTERAPS